MSKAAARPVVFLSDIRMHPDISWTYKTYNQLVEDGKVAKKYVRSSDYRRWSLVRSVLDPAESFLDIGIGIGHFVNAMAQSGSYARVTGMDLNRRPALQVINENWNFVRRSVADAKMPEELRADVVTCMECIEHVPDPDFDQAVANLKHLAKKKLVVTVPYLEDEPIPSFHHQRFDWPRLQKLFPGGEVTLISAGNKIYWAMVEWSPAG